MEITQEQIKEIAEFLDIGMRCFYNKISGKILTCPDFNRNYDADQEIWAEIIEEIDNNYMDLVEFLAMESYDSFGVMEDFTETIDDVGLRSKLIYALSHRKPFQNFKWHIDNSGNYRQMWFDFKNERYIEWVKDQIEVNNLTDTNE